MYYGEIKKSDIANGPGVRVTLFVSGCTNHCKECFQPQTWDFEFGRPFDDEAREVILSELSKSYVRGLTLLGGEPMEPRNQAELVFLLREIKEKYPSKDVWCFSGFRLDDEIMAEDGYPHCEYTAELLSMIDVLVDGRFDIEQKDISLRFRGSRNQRLIDMKQTLALGEIVLWEDGMGRPKSAEALRMNR